MTIVLNGTTGITTPGTDSTTLVVNSNNISAVNSLGFRNRIINGDMRIDQRNAGASLSLSATGQYTVDRWQAWEDTDGTMTAQQSSVAPTGFTNSLLFTTGTADASLAAAQFAALQQRIEGFNVADLGWGTANAQAITVSFWVRSSLTGTFGGAIKNSAFNRAYPFTYTISAANTWEQKSVTIPGDTAGTWLTNSSTGIILGFGFGVGSDYAGTAGAWAANNALSATGAVSVIGTAGATFYITGVQLEAGSVASPFERRDYGRELMMCQRYYENNYNGQAVGATVTGGSVYAYNVTITPSNGYAGFGIPFKVTKRAAPTTTVYSYTGVINQWHYGKAGQSEVIFTTGTVYSSTYSFSCWTSGIPTDQNIMYGMFSASAEL